MIRVILLTLLVAVSPLSVAKGLASKDPAVKAALHYLNTLRQQAGMIPFSMDETLSRAAQQHAQYLYEHKQWGHEQQYGKPGFSGQTPMERIIKAGYSSRHNSENVSSHRGKAGPVKSINGLMSAIYHRFGFLSFDYNEIGIGHASDGRFHSYVYNMGNSRKAELCSSQPETPITGKYVYKVCADEAHMISAGAFDQAKTSVQLKNADVVVWPPDKGKNIPAGFYEEAPDPLPHHDVSGYPVSVQFNPIFFKNNIPQVTRFELYQLPENRAVQLITRFDNQKDINRKFTEYEHAIFPLHRLQWGTDYRVELEYITPDKQTHHLEWQFKTASFDMPYYEVNGGEVINADNAVLAVYSPPVSKNDARSEYQVSFQGFEDVKVAIVDAHTLVISPVGNRGQALFDFHGKQFKVVR